MKSWFHTFDASIHLTFDDASHDQLYAAAKESFADILRLLRRKGFKIGYDDYVRKNYSTLSKSHRRGVYARHKAGSDLEVKLNYSGRVVEIQFFQNVVRENPNGGEYDFNKLQKMPYVVRLRFLWIRDIIIKQLRKIGMEDRTDRVRSIQPDPLAFFNQGWDSDYERSRGIHRFERGPDGWPSDKEINHWDRKDRDGNVLSHGETRYVAVGGRLFRCRVFGGINGMWWAIWGPGHRDWTQASHGELTGRFVHGRVFDERKRKDSINKAFRKAIEGKSFRRAEAILRHCERSAIELSGYKLSLT